MAWTLRSVWPWKPRGLPERLTVVCFKWFDARGQYNSRFLYTADHVNRLARQVARNVSIEHDLVCVTDDPAGLDPAIRAVPIDRELLATAGHRYPKLMIFRPDAAEWLGERILMLDLDTVIVGSLDRLIAHPAPLVMWQDPSWGKPGGQGRYNSSMVLLTAGSHPEVWTSFQAPRDAEGASRKHSDQAWIWEAVGPGLPVWTRKDGVLSFRHDLMRHRRSTGEPMPTRPTRLPFGARVVFLHGGRDPASGKMKNHAWVRRHWR